MSHILWRTTLTDTMKPSSTSGARLLALWALPAAFALLLTFMPDSTHAQGNTVATDKTALVALYNATGDSSWTTSTNWSSDQQLSSWHGVTTNSDGRVTELDLNGNGLNGTLPAALGNLSELQHLDLGANNLSGALPSALTDLTNLEELLLNESRALSGSLPNGLRELTALETVNIEDTELCAPDDEAFQTWLKTITFDGLECPPSAQSVIDVAVFYTRRARDIEGGTNAIRDAIDVMVASANTAYSNSVVNQRVSLVATEEIAYVEEGFQLDHIRFRTPSDGIMDEVQAIRDQFAADIAVMLRRDSNPSLAYNSAIPMTTVTESFGYHAYAVVDILSPDDVFAHELGHTMGLRHDRYVACDFFNSVTHERECQTGPFPYSHGYTNQRAFDAAAPASARWRTIMSYTDQCDDSSISCSRVRYFSNPDRTYRGDPMGIAGLEPSTSQTDGPSDAARALNRTRGYVARFLQAIPVTVVLRRRSVHGDGGGQCSDSYGPTERAAYPIDHDSDHVDERQRCAGLRLHSSTCLRKFRTVRHRNYYHRSGDR